MLVKDMHFDFKGQKIFIGIDVHLLRVVLTSVT